MNVLYCVYTRVRVPKESRREAGGASLEKYYEEVEGEHVCSVDVYVGRLRIERREWLINQICVVGR